MPPRTTLVPILILTLLLPACSAYERGFAYGPSPLEANLTRSPTDAGTDGDTIVRTLVSVVGVRKPVPKANMPSVVEVRIRIENVGAPDEVRFDPRSLTLLSADLREFPAPYLEPMDPIAIAPAETATLEALFPFPAEAGDPDGIDLDALRLEWSIDVGGRPFPGAATVKRRRTVYWRSRPYDYGWPYAYPYYRGVWWSPYWGYRR